MKDFERLVMPRPKDESNEKVPVLGWEFLALLSVLIAMAPWFTWRPSQESRRLSLPLGSLDDAERWYAEKLVWYSSFYHRESVLKAIQQRMETFFKECEPGLPTSLRLDLLILIKKTCASSLLFLSFQIGRAHV